MFSITEGKGFQLSFANGWTASVQWGRMNLCENRNNYDRKPSGDEYMSKTAEVWAWHEDGRNDAEVQGWRSVDEVLAFLNEVAERK
jgi:hypothetical protein